ncbi:hypothetical protein OUZ56_025160 [Daphnia magna]|uniref:Uncharacterized protein n=1 Tax=Daphnia magna TaxID=35525 RepID=A0ABQ9ZK19_9CRUS|nr:hypothetical protein OUZ56_025160 [Daphnia magna]
MSKKLRKRKRAPKIVLRHLAENYQTVINASLKDNLVSARRSRRVETVTRTSQWDYPGPLIGSLHPYILLCLSAFRSHIFLMYTVWFSVGLPL